MRQNRLLRTACVLSALSSVLAQDLQTELTKVCQDTGMVGLSVIGVCKGEITDQFYYG